MAIRTNKKTVSMSYDDFYRLMTRGQTGTVEAKTETKATKKKAKTPALSLNNPYVVFSDELGQQTVVEEKEGWLHFTNPSFKSGRAQGYAVADLRKAHEMFVADKYDEICVKTNVKMALVGDYKVSETLVKIAEAKNLI